MHIAVLTMNIFHSVHIHIHTHPYILIRPNCIRTSITKAFNREKNVRYLSLRKRGKNHFCDYTQYFVSKKCIQLKIHCSTNEHG